MQRASIASLANLGDDDVSGDGRGLVSYSRLYLLDPQIRHHLRFFTQALQPMQSSRSGQSGPEDMFLFVNPGSGGNKGKARPTVPQQRVSQRVELRLHLGVHKQRRSEPSGWLS